MLAPASLTHCSWSLNLGTSIIVSALDVWAKILGGNYHLNNCY